MNKKNLLITTGPTREYLDPVRFISNPSSGKLGFEIANVFKNKFNVTVISGPTNISYPKNVNVVYVETAQQMFFVVKKYFKKCDIFISAAAVTDYKPKNFSSEKIKKSNKPFILQLVPTKDILSYCSKNKNKNQTIIGFALETHNKIKNAINKLINKKLDFIILNSTESFNNDNIKATIIDSKKNILQLPNMTKKYFAKYLLNYVLPKL